MRGRYGLRGIVDAIAHRWRSGCRWAELPKGLPPHTVVAHQFRKWSQDGTADRLAEILRIPGARTSYVRKPR